MFFQPISWLVLKTCCVMTIAARQSESRWRRLPTTRNRKLEPTRRNTRESGLGWKKYQQGPRTTTWSQSQLPRWHPRKRRRRLGVISADNCWMTQICGCSPETLVTQWVSVFDVEWHNFSINIHFCCQACYETGQCRARQYNIWENTAIWQMVTHLVACLQDSVGKLAAERLNQSGF